MPTVFSQILFYLVAKSFCIYGDLPKIFVGFGLNFVEYKISMLFLYNLAQFTVFSYENTSMWLNRTTYRSFVSPELIDDGEIILYIRGSINLIFYFFILSNYHFEIP